MDDSSAAEFDRLLRGHVRELYRYAYRWTGDVDQAEDLVQETLTRLYPDMPRLKKVEKLRPWMARVMYRIFVDGLRRARNSPVSFVGRSGSTGATLDGAALDGEADPEAIDGADEGSDTPVLAEQMLDRERLAAAWSQLHEQHRVVLSLHDIEGYSLEEVAQIIEAPLGTAKSRLHRARVHLREMLTDGESPASPALLAAHNPVRNGRG